MSENNSKQATQKRHIPVRRCVLCRNSKTQSELIRFYKTDTGTWELDKHHLGKLELKTNTKQTDTIQTNTIKTNTKKAIKPSGRGAWVCLDAGCHNPKKLSYFFKKQAEDIEALLESLTAKHESTGTDVSKPNLSQETQFHSGGMNV